MNPYCPKCDIKMDEVTLIIRDKETGSMWICPDCNYEIDEVEKDDFSRGDDR